MGYTNLILTASMWVGFPHIPVDVSSGVMDFYT